MFSAFGFFALVSGFCGFFSVRLVLLVFSAFGFLAFVSGLSLAFSVLLVLFGRFGPLRLRRFFVVLPYVSNIDSPLSRFNDSN